MPDSPLSSPDKIDRLRNTAVYGASTNYSFSKDAADQLVAELRRLHNVIEEIYDKPDKSREIAKHSIEQTRKFLEN